MTTDQHPQPDRHSQPDDDQAVTRTGESEDPVTDPMTEARELLEGISDLDPAEAVEPLTRITSLLNDALDEVRERL